MRGVISMKKSHRVERLREIISDIFYREIPNMNASALFSIGLDNTATTKEYVTSISKYLSDRKEKKFVELYELLKDIKNASETSFLDFKMRRFVKLLNVAENVRDKQIEKMKSSVEIPNQFDIKKLYITLAETDKSGTGRGFFNLFNNGPIRNGYTYTSPRFYLGVENKYTDELFYIGDKSHLYYPENNFDILVMGSNVEKEKMSSVYEILRDKTPNRLGYQIIENSLPKSEINDIVKTEKITSAQIKQILNYCNKNESALKQMVEYSSNPFSVLPKDVKSTKNTDDIKEVDSELSSVIDSIHKETLGK